MRYEAETTSPDVGRVLQMTRLDLEYLQNASLMLKDYGDSVTNQLMEALDTHRRLEDEFNSGDGNPSSGDGNPSSSMGGVASHREIMELMETVEKLKLQIPSWQRNSYFYYDKYESSNGGWRISDRTKAEDIPSLCKNEVFERSTAFEDLKALYDGLPVREKMCLLSFSVFPENVIINRRFMVYWWIGEGFVRACRGNQIAENNSVEEVFRLSRGGTAEDMGNEVFKELMMKGFIEPVNKRPDLEFKRCRMHPLIRAAVIMLADRAKFFDFDGLGNLTASFASLRACLLAHQDLKDRPYSGQDFGKIHTLFNVDMQVLDFENLEMFSKMTSLNVLCLGRWQASYRHPIEVDDTRIFRGLKNMKNLRLLSLQGITNISALPQSISKLASLNILDLRSCHKLQHVPAAIGSLKSLTHLDMSECYLLEKMPKQLSSLSELQVLKGFVVGNWQGENSCTLKDLARLPKLQKLSIHAFAKHFPGKADLENLHKFHVLSKLKIEWSVGSKGKSGKSAEQERIRSSSIVEEATTPAGRMIRRLPTFRDRTPPAVLPSQLKKLGLQCFPQSHESSWLKASKLRGLKKLCIRGGSFWDLGQFERQKDKWDVEILRLKFLKHLDMDWSELRVLFPKLIYLEKVKCPKLSLFPCDEHGIWMSKTDK